MKMVSRTNWSQAGVVEDTGRVEGSLSAVHPGGNIKTSRNVPELLGFFCFK